MLMPQLVILAISGIPFGFHGVYLEITSGIAKDSFRIAAENSINAGRVHTRNFIRTAEVLEKKY
jgi:hypothetical protein